jgi:3-deoxy-manno-octulosonate cytidylyltransferase (CMP-KDO synthetase)
MSDFVVVIPARYASSRLPGKPLADIDGVPMVVRVVRQAMASRAARVVVATDDVRVANAVRDAGHEVCMTRADHPSGTDRIEEVATQLQLPDDAIVVNVQGDEPLIPPENIDQVAGNLAAHADCSAATLCEPIVSGDDWFNPNIVKVVTDRVGRALYFSRAPMPWARDELARRVPGSTPARAAPGAARHIGIYAYRVGLLRDFVGWGACALEQVEALEQLRILYNGERIHVADALCPAPGGVDTPEDLERVRAALAAD